MLEILAAVPREPLSLDDPIGEDEDRTLAEAIAGDGVAPDEQVIALDETRRVKRLMGRLSPMEMDIITRRYGLGSDEEAESTSLRDAMRHDTHPDGSPVYTPLTGLSLMVFFVLAMQCMSTLAAVKRETRSWRWPIFQTAYMTVLAVLASFLVYQGGRLLGFGA